MTKEDEVPVTGALLAFIGVLHGARKQFMSETQLAEALGTAMPKDYWRRCEELYFKKFAAEVQQLGLAANWQTFEAIMRVEVSVELLRTPFDELPKRFVFDPWLGMGYGGFKRLEAA